MGYFRHPKTQNQRKGDQALQYEGRVGSIYPNGRLRSGKQGHALPTERDDKTPSARKDRSRGKASHSPARKARIKARNSC